MYLINSISLQVAQQMFIAAARFRTGQGLVGPKNGVNAVFRLPGSERFTHNLPFFTICVCWNGLRLTLIDDYIISESGGPGTGYDTVTLSIAPGVGDNLIADYLVPGP